MLSVEGTDPGTGEPSFAIDLVPDGPDLIGSVTNTTSETLTNVLVSSGQAISRIATLAPGEAKQVTLRNPNTVRIQGDVVTEQLNSGDPWTPNDGDTNPGVLLDYLARSPRLRGAGIVMAIGWTRAAEPTIETLSGAPIANGRTAFLTAVRVDQSKGDTSSAPAPLEFLRGYASSASSDRSTAGSDLHRHPPHLEHGSPRIRWHRGPAGSRHQHSFGRGTRRLDRRRMATRRHERSGRQAHSPGSLPCPPPPELAPCSTSGQRSAAKRGASPIPCRP